MIDTVPNAIMLFFLFLNDQEVGEVMVEHFAADQVLVDPICSSSFYCITAVINHIRILSMEMKL